jgi:diguanylate cyclase (GGDEF)-like protein/PAS domain S-box-containing protein
MLRILRSEWGPIAMKIDEQQRVVAVQRLGLMGTVAEPELEDLVQLMATIFEAPISFLSIIDEDRQWILASVGLSMKEFPRNQSFCQHTIKSDLMIVEDTLRDERFKEHPMVASERGLRFYAGTAIKTTDGQPVGTLCIGDVVPRTMSEKQVNALRVLGLQANARIELREQRRELQRALFEAERARAELAASERQFQAFMDNAPFMSSVKDSEGKYLYYSRALAERYGISREAWLGKRIVDLFPANVIDIFHRHDMDVIESGEQTVIGEAFLYPAGAPSHVRMYRFPYSDGEHRMLGTVSIDETEAVEREAELHRYQRELEAANAKLAELAATDPLTGLANRRVFDDRLSTEFSQARRKNRGLSVMMIDVDDFKQLNDSYGHEEGDLCLQQMADLLSNLVREPDLIARYGGEEFILLLPETDEDQALHLAERMLATIRSHTWKWRPITVSGGIASLSSEMRNQQQLIGKADEALYAAKHAGKDRFIVADQGAV